MTGFDPKGWTASFEAAGGLVGVMAGDDGAELWAGVIRDRPDRGREAVTMMGELHRHPEWRVPLLAYAADRLRSH